eukprot:UN08212
MFNLLGFLLILMIFGKIILKRLVLYIFNGIVKNVLITKVIILYKMKLKQFKDNNSIESNTT